jgi:hypothetical protein
MFQETTPVFFIDGLNFRTHLNNFEKKKTRLAYQKLLFLQSNKTGSFL